MKKEPVWIEKQALLLLHARSLSRFGGATALREEGLLDSALARPRNLFSYHEKADVAALAASYAFGLIKDHPFVDGNKRAGFLAMGIFLELNGLKLTASQAEAISAILALASGAIHESQLAAWIRLNVKR